MHKTALSLKFPFAGVIGPRYTVSTGLQGGSGQQVEKYNEYRPMIPRQYDSYAPKDEQKTKKRLVNWLFVH